MKKIHLTETEFQSYIKKLYIEESNNILEEKWKRLTENEKTFIINFLSITHPKKSKLVNEAWYNTLGDIVGIFDPTGVVDLVNGISYFNQGDTLFGIMSLISAVPYIGDVVGKPVILGLKAGGDVAKAMRAAKTTTQWASLGKRYKIIGALLEKIQTIGPKLLSIIEKAPGGKRFTNIVRKWVGSEGVLTKAAKEYKYTSTAGKKMSGNIINDLEKVSLSKTLKDSLKLTAGETRAFRDFGKGNWGFLTKILKKVGWWKNPQLTKLLSKTKFWLGFLDFVGIANFVGPEELSNQLSDEQMQANLEDYMNTPEGKENWESEMGNVPQEETQNVTQNKIKDVVKKQFGGDPISSLISMLT